LVGGRARAVGLVLRSVRRRCARRGVVAGGRAATRPRGDGPSPGGVAPCVGSAASGRRPALEVVGVLRLCSSMGTFGGGVSCLRRLASLLHGW
jgi:hypothetical protein